MGSAIVVVLFSFLMQALASELVELDMQNGYMQNVTNKRVDTMVQKLADSLLDRLPKASPLHDKDMDDTTLGKPGQVGVFNQGTSLHPARFARSPPGNVIHPPSSSIHPRHKHASPDIVIRCNPMVTQALRKEAGSDSPKVPHSWHFGTKTLRNLGKSGIARGTAQMSRPVAKPHVEEDKQLDSRDVAEPFKKDEKETQLWTLKARAKRQKALEEQLLPKENKDKLKEKFGFENIEKRKAEAAKKAKRAVVSLPDEAKTYFREIEGADVDPDLIEAAPSDFFELLGVSEVATSKDVKAAYRQKMKIAHPDIAGPAATQLGVVLNKAYKTLSNDEMRAAYAAQIAPLKAAIGSFDGRPRSKWAGPAGESRAVFVDESVCIGCTLCNTYAPETFGYAETSGRARCDVQWADTEEDLQISMEMCPVDCIHWVRRDQLAVLEYIMKHCEVENIANMGVRRANAGSSRAQFSPWGQAERLMRQRKQARRNFGDDMDLRSIGDTEVMAGAIAAAWLELPPEVRQSGWPKWEKKEEGPESQDTEKSDPFKIDMSKPFEWVNSQVEWDPYVPS